MDEIICPACGAPNPVESTICETCGEDLGTIRSVVDSANTHYNEAIALAHQGRLDEAIGKMEAALALSAQNPQFYNLLGTLHGQKGEYREAIDAWERALAIDPEMEKAYGNIEKARRMVDEPEDEEGRRPFLLAAIGAGVLALLLLAATIFSGVKAYQQKQSITSLNSQLEERTLEQQKVEADLNATRAQIQAITEKYPGGLEQIEREMTQQKNLLTERQAYVDRLEQTRKAEVEALRNQIAELQRERGQLTAKANESNSLQGVLQTTQAQVQQLEQQLKEKDAQLNIANQKAEQQKDSLLLAQDTIASIRSDRDRAINNLIKGNNQSLDEVNRQMLEMRSEVAAYEKRMENLDKANAQLAEALKNLESNNFETAQQNVNDALTQSPNHATALYLQTLVQGILNDPVEQDLRRSSTTQQQQQRETRRTQLVQQTLQSARNYYSQGQYDLALREADRVAALEPKDTKSIEAARRIKQDAGEASRSLSMLMLEARKDFEEGKLQEAQETLSQILRRSPTYADALELQRKMTQ